jgi:hypothetical protein
MNTTALTPIQAQQVAAWEDTKVMQMRINRMHELMRNVMKENIHYGIIPGCKKPSLYQPGQQLLGVTFKVGFRPTVERLVEADNSVRYMVTTEVFSQDTGAVLGYGLGECSSSEEKYAWREAVNQKEFDSFPQEMKRIKYKRGYRDEPDKEIPQVRTNPADVANTILKMAKKRSSIDASLNVLAASEIFTQDIEDLPEGMPLEEGQPPRQSSKPETSAPSEVQKPTDDIRKKNKWISEGQEKRLYAVLKANNVDIADFKAWLKLMMKKDHMYMISWPAKEYDKIVEHIEKSPKDFAGYADKLAAATTTAAAESTGKSAFQLSIEGYASLLGKTLTEMEDIIQEEFSFIGLADVPEAKQDEILDYFKMKVGEKKQ